VAKRRAAAVPQRELERAARLYRGFRERGVGKTRRRMIDWPEVAVHIGRVRAFDYETTHGAKPILYRHKFAKWARPEFLVSPDGRHLLILPGNFSFTARGIVDRRRR